MAGSDYGLWANVQRKRSTKVILRYVIARLGAGSSNRISHWESQ